MTTQDKCFYSFLLGLIISIVILFGSIYFFSKDKGEFLDMLFRSKGVNR